MTGMFHPGFEVWRPARTSDGQGGWVEAFALSSAVTGRLSPLSGAEVMAGDKQRGVISLRFSTGAATDIKGGDQVRYQGRIAEVQAVRITSTGRRKECACEERAPS